MVAATGAELPGTAAYGIALLSRYPVRSWQVVRLPAIPFRFPMWLHGPRRVVVVSEEPRVAVAALVETPHGLMSIATAHLSFVPGGNAVQLRRLRRDLRTLPDPLVLMGDLNLTGARPARLTGYRPLVTGPTYPADAANVPLYPVLRRGPAVPARATAVVELPLSDHRAVTVDL